MAIPPGGDRQMRPEQRHLQTVARRAEGSRSGVSLAPRSVRRITSEQLFVQGNEVIIDHAGREYRLRLTASGKLILTA